MYRVIVSDDVAQEGLDLLEAAPGIAYEVRTGLKGAALCVVWASSTGAVCRSGVKITAESMEGKPPLEGHRAGRRGHGQHRPRCRHAAGHRGP